MDTAVIKQRIIEHAWPEFKDSGYDLVHVKVARQGKGCVVEIFADRMNGGITIGECAQINKKIIGRIDGESLIEGPYELIVCSPGIDFPIKTRKDFLRNIGKEVDVFLNEPLNEKVEWRGIIKDVNDERVIIGLVSKATGSKKKVAGQDNVAQDMEIPIGNIIKAIQII